MRSILILGLTALVLGCQPSIEEQAKREIAVEAEKKKQLLDGKVNRTANEQKADKLFIETLRLGLEEDNSSGAAERLNIFNTCIENKKLESEATACYLKSQRQ